MGWRTAMTAARYPGEPDILTGIRTALGIAGDRLALTSAADQPVCVAIAPAQTHRKLLQTDSEWISAPTAARHIDRADRIHNT